MSGSLKGGFSAIKPQWHLDRDQADSDPVLETSAKTGDQDRNPLGLEISPVELGLTIINCLDRTQLSEVRNTVTMMALQGSKNLGIPMPMVDAVLSIYSGGSRRVGLAKALCAANLPIKKSAAHEFKAVGTRDGYDYCSDEGLSILLPIIQQSSGWWVILEQPCSWPFSTVFVAGLSYIRHAAKIADVRVMIFLTCPESHDKTGLHQLCDEFIEVIPCEPDTDSHVAFAFDCINLRDFNQFGVGKIMCNVRAVEKQLHRRFEPLIATDLKSRVLWYLRGHGKTLEEIGELLDMNKSTVSRRLAGLPKPRNIVMSEGWLESYLQSEQGVLALSNHD
jgi:hypothetical protein